MSEDRRGRFGLFLPASAPPLFVLTLGRRFARYPFHNFIARNETIRILLGAATEIKHMCNRRFHVKGCETGQIRPARND
jgi:hypothetical protein